MSGITREDVLANMQAAADRMGLDLEDLQEMITEVLEDCTRKTLLLKEAIESNDSTNVKAIAHDIKGSTANYGLKSVSEIAQQIEQNFESAPEGAIEKLVKQFDEFAKLNLDKT